MELHSNTGSNQVDFHLPFIFHLLFVFCMDLTHSQVNADIEVSREIEKEQDSEEAETEVPKLPSAHKGKIPYPFFL